MRKVIVSMMVTLDGYFEGPNGEIDWHNVDEEFNEFAIQQLNSMDILLFGRVTYEMMASYWPTPTALGDDPIVAGLMNNTPKIVFSRTLEKVTWNNTRLVKGDLVAEVAQLKQQPGKDMVIFGSGSLVSTLTEHGLIDEYRIFVNPVILGSGNSMFKGLHERVNLELLNTRVFRSGNVLLSYRPAEKNQEA